MTREIRLLGASSVSACIELVNEYVVFGSCEYTVFLNGVDIGIRSSQNIISLFHLTPDTEYVLKVVQDDGDIHHLDFKTKPESIAISIMDFFPHADGVALDTKAFQAAIDVCPQGGRIIVPFGKYLISPIVLKSDITLDIQEGATIIGSTYKEDYAVLPGQVVDHKYRATLDVDTVLKHDSDAVIDEDGEEELLIWDNCLQISSWQGAPKSSYQSLISAYNCKNVSIVGKGTIDGNAVNSVWYIDTKNRKTAKPRLVFLNDCDNVLIHGINLKDSPSWVVHPFFCKNVSILDSKLSVPKDSPNTDGINPESCDGVHIVGCEISASEECIGIKSGKYDMAMRYKTPCQNINIRNCTLSSGTSAVVLGSELSAGIFNLTVSQSLFKATKSGISINTRRGRGHLAKIQGLIFNNIIMLDVHTPFVINSFYNNDPDGHSEYVQSRNPKIVDYRTPYIGRINFSNIVCKGVQHACAFLYGLPEAPIEEVKFENVHFSVAVDAKKGMPAMMDGLEECSRRGIIQQNVKNIVQNGVIFDGIDGHDY